jgi:hypothetical protein
MNTTTEDDSRNGWERHQIAVLNELGRLADQGEKTAVLLQAHEIHFAKLEEQNRQRDEILQNLVNETRVLRADVNEVKNDRRLRLSGHVTRKRLISVGVMILTWTIGTALTVYEVFFTNHIITPPHHP